MYLIISSYLYFLPTFDKSYGLKAVDKDLLRKISKKFTCPRCQRYQFLRKFFVYFHRSTRNNNNNQEHAAALEKIQNLPALDLIIKGLPRTEINPTMEARGTWTCQYLTA